MCELLHFVHNVYIRPRYSKSKQATITSNMVTFKQIFNRQRHQLSQIHCLICPYFLKNKCIGSFLSCFKHWWKVHQCSTFNSDSVMQWDPFWQSVDLLVYCMYKHIYNHWYLYLTISNEGDYLTFKLVFHKALTLFNSILKSRSNPWNQPVLSNKGKVSCSRKQRGPLIRLEPTTSTLRVRRATHCPVHVCVFLLLLCETISPESESRTLNLKIEAKPKITKDKKFKICHSLFIHGHIVFTHMQVISHII